MISLTSYIDNALNKNLIANPDALRNPIKHPDKTQEPKTKGLEDFSVKSIYHTDLLWLHLQHLSLLDTDELRAIKVLEQLNAFLDQLILAAQLQKKTTQVTGYLDFKIFLESHMGTPNHSDLKKTIESALKVWAYALAYTIDTQDPLLKILLFYNELRKNFVLILPFYKTEKKPEIALAHINIFASYLTALSDRGLIKLTTDKDIVELMLHRLNTKEISLSHLHLDLLPTFFEALYEVKPISKL